MAKTKVLKIDPASPDRKIIQFAAALLRSGGLVAFPTETVYGIGVNFLDKKAVERLYEVKKRPKDKPFTIHIAQIDTMRGLCCEFSPLAEKLIKNFWPGPLTIILKSGTKKLGFRMPANTVAKALIAESGVPVAAPSANISGAKPPVDAENILKEFDGKIDLVLDAGKTEFRKESTVVDITESPYRILREGAVSQEEIEESRKNLV